MADRNAVSAAGSSSQMTHEERLALAEKLDKELDDFISGLEKKRYTDGWPEDRWQEEMEKHPFFMKTVPENGEMSPLAQGLANLKYDPDENTPEELAVSYKEDGNFNFKYKNYRLSILGYTEGIRVKCGHPEIESSLYNNRAAAQFHLKNYRSCLADCEKALTLKPDHSKARLRAAQCALILSKYDQCIEHCEKASVKDDQFENLLREAKEKKKIKERDQRKRERASEKLDKEKEEIKSAILQRGVKIFNHDSSDELDLTLVEPNLPGTADSIVKLVDGLLFWPLLILYPEYGTTDYIRNCPENVPLSSQLVQLFPAPWDDDGKYSMGSINMYYEGDDQKQYKVDFSENLGDILVQKHYILKAGTPAFIIVVRNSDVEKKFLESS